MIRIEKLNKSFGSKQLFSNFALQLGTNKIYALKGQSGSGKTTLLNIIAKLEPYESGTIQIQGKSLDRIPTRLYFRDTLGYLFQNFGLIEHATISENLDLAFVGKKMKKSERTEQKKQVLSRVGLEEKELDTKIYTLSGGEAQRVAIAKLFLKNPHIILADEPTAALDPKNSEEIMKILQSLRNEERVILIATHDPIVWDMADEIIEISG